MLLTLSAMGDGIWYDEALSWYIAKQPISQIWQYQFFDSAPALYYIFLHFFIQIFGESQIALRLLSIFSFFCTAYFIYKICTKLFKESPSVLPSLFFMATPAALFYAVQIRSYSLLFSLYSIYLFSMLSPFRTKRHFIFSLIFAGLIIYIHNIGVIWLCSTFIFLYFFHSPNHRRSLTFHFLCVGLLTIPWLLLMLSQSKSYQFAWVTQSWGNWPLWAMPIKSIASLISQSISQEQFIIATFPHTIAPLGVIWISIFLYGWKKSKKKSTLLLTIWLLPLFAFVLLSYFWPDPVYIFFRTDTIALIGISITVGFWETSIKKPLVISGLVTIIMVSTLSIKDHHILNRQYKKTIDKSTAFKIQKIIKENDRLYLDWWPGLPIYYYLNKKSQKFSMTTMDQLRKNWGQKWSKDDEHLTKDINYFLHKNKKESYFIYTRINKNKNKININPELYHQIMASINGKSRVHQLVITSTHDWTNAVGALIEIKNKSS